MTGQLPDPDTAPASLEAQGSAVWHRLHPLSPFVRAGRQMMSLLVVVVGVAVLNQRQARGDLVIDAVVIAAALAGGFVSWLVTRWQVADGVLRIDTGLLRRDSQRIPMTQVQAVDVVQSGLARVLGLAEIQVRVAGGDSAHRGRLACLRLPDAEDVRRQLLVLAGQRQELTAGREPGTVAEGPGTVAGGPGTVATVAGEHSSVAGESGAPGPQPGRAGQPAVAASDPDRLLFRVRASRLPAAIVLTGSGARAVVVAAATALTAQLTGSAATITPFLPVVLGVVLALWRQFNGEYGTVIVTAPDGLRLRSGLIQTTAETIRPGRIQAVRMSEPLIWRAFGWCRLEADVAGSRQLHEDASQGRRLRALIPVGSRAEADQVLAALLRSRPLPVLAAPGRARWKAPFGYHFLGWSGDAQYVVAARGRVRRQTTWVPLEKVQSVRWVQGPVQRRLGLASVLVDVAGKRVTARITDRDSAEALRILRELPDLARAARARAG